MKALTKNQEFLSIFGASLTIFALVISLIMTQMQNKKIAHMSSIIIGTVFCTVFAILASFYCPSLVVYEPEHDPQSLEEKRANFDPNLVRTPEPDTTQVTSGAEHRDPETEKVQRKSHKIKKMLNLLLNPRKNKDKLNKTGKIDEVQVDNASSKVPQK